jgi:PKD repeat protein
MQIVAVNDSVQNCSIDVGSAVAFIGQMQLAPDNQIYISLTAQCNDVHIIRHPDVRGVGCEVEQNAIVLPTFVFGTIPNTNTYRLGPLDGSPADTLDINNLPVSRFWYEQDSSDFLSVQLWDVSYFRPEQWQWSFGDGQTSTERHPLHSYQSNGIYEVCLTVSNENSNDTSCETLFLGTSDTEDIESDISLSVFPNPTEGLTRFLLSGYLPQDGVLTLYDLQGRVVHTQQMRTGATVVDLSGLDIGTYVYELRDGNAVIGSGKVVRI